MTDLEATQMIKDMIDRNRDNIQDLAEALEREKNTCAIVSHSWVVVMPMIGCMNYTLEPIAGSGRKRAVDPVPAWLACRAHRYTREDAERIAANTFNAAGEAGAAMHWVDAAEAELAELLQMNEDLAKAA